MALHQEGHFGGGSDYNNKDAPPGMLTDGDPTEINSITKCLTERVLKELAETVETAVRLHLSLLEPAVNKKVDERIANQSDSITVDQGKVRRKAQAIFDVNYTEVCNIVEQRSTTRDRLMTQSSDHVAKDTAFHKSNDEGAKMRDNITRYEDKITEISMSRPTNESTNGKAKRAALDAQIRKIRKVVEVLTERFGEHSKKTERLLLDRKRLETDKESSEQILAAYDQRVNLIMKLKQTVADKPPKYTLIERKLEEFGPLTANEFNVHHGKPDEKVVKKIEVIMVSLFSQYAKDLITLYPFYAKIMHERQLGKHASIPPNIVALNTGTMLEPNTLLRGMSESYKTAYIEANKLVYALFSVGHSTGLTECNASFNKTDKGEGKDVRGCMGDFMTALYLCVSFNESKGWTLRQKRIAFYLESPAYAKTVRSVEVFFKNMMEPMATSIEANIEVPFNVCLQVITNLQTRHHIFNSLYEKYKQMDADALNIQYNALSQLQQLLGEIRQTASSSGITNLPAGVNANHVTVATQLNEFTAAAVEVIGPDWNGRSDGASASGACYKCGKTGHIKRDCPDTKTSGRGGGSRGRGRRKPSASRIL